MQRMKVVLPEPDGADDDDHLLALDRQRHTLEDVQLAEPLLTSVASTRRHPTVVGPPPIALRMSSAISVISDPR